MQDLEVPSSSRREYLSLLWIVTAAILGCLLLGGTAAVGVNDINRRVLTGTPTTNIVNYIIYNLNTAVVATVVEFSTLVPPPIVRPSQTATITTSPTITSSASVTSAFFVPPTSAGHGNANGNLLPSATSTKTMAPLLTPTKISTSTKVPEPTQTSTLVPSNTPNPTNTLVPTDTPVPPTDTAVPPTDTVPPPDTDTPVPPPTTYP